MSDGRCLQIEQLQAIVYANEAKTPSIVRTLGHVVRELFGCYKIPQGGKWFEATKILGHFPQQHEFVSGNKKLLFNQIVLVVNDGFYQNKCSL